MSLAVVGKSLFQKAPDSRQPSVAKRLESPGLDFKKRPIGLVLQAAVDFPPAATEIDDYCVLQRFLANAPILKRAAAKRENRRGLTSQGFLNRLFLKSAKGAFTAGTEYLGDTDVRFLFDRRIDVYEAPSQSARQPRSNRGLAGTGKTDQDDMPVNHHPFSPNTLR